VPESAVGLAQSSIVNVDSLIAAVVGAWIEPVPATAEVGAAPPGKAAEPWFGPANAGLLVPLNVTAPVTVPVLLLPEASVIVVEAAGLFRRHHNSGESAVIAEP
jgi:hypothetical protein